MQYCAGHLERRNRSTARYLERVDTDPSDQVRARLHALLGGANDNDTSLTSSNILLDNADAVVTNDAATHLLRTPDPTLSPSQPTPRSDFCSPPPRVRIAPNGSSSGSGEIRPTAPPS